MSHSSDPQDGAAHAIADPRGAIARLGGDVELYKDIVSALFRSAPDQIKEMRAAVAAGDADRAHHLAHQMKGLSSSCGASEITRWAAKLSQATADKQLDEAADTLAHLERAIVESQQALAEYVDLSRPNP